VKNLYVKNLDHFPDLPENVAACGGGIMLSRPLRRALRGTSVGLAYSHLLRCTSCKSRFMISRLTVRVGSADLSKLGTACGGEGRFRCKRGRK
jgi:hypothetical protein